MTLEPTDPEVFQISHAALKHPTATEIEEVANDTKDLNWEDVRRIGLTLPGTEAIDREESPSLSANGKMFARLYRDRANIVVRMRKSERSRLIAEKPDLFHVLPQYAGFPYCLVRLVAISEKDLTSVLRAGLEEVAG